MIRAWMFAGNSVDMSPDVPVTLTVPSVPLVAVGTAVIAETPVTAGPVTLTVPAVPTVTVSTAVE